MRREIKRRRRAVRRAKRWMNMEIQRAVYAAMLERSCTGCGNIPASPACSVKCAIEDAIKRVLAQYTQPPDVILRGGFEAVEIKGTMKA